MGKLLYPNGKPCVCGCGLSAERYYLHGQFKGYARYHTGHSPAKGNATKWLRSEAGREWLQTIRWNKAARKKQSRWMRAHAWNKKPVGSRQISRFSSGLQYWRIKTADGRWRFEHRVVMEDILKRKLKSSEHVHHINGNGLDNKPENLVVMNDSDHHRLTIQSTKLRCRCPRCGAVHLRKRH